MVRNEAHELDCGKDATKPWDLTAENGGTKPHRGLIGVASHTAMP